MLINLGSEESNPPCEIGLPQPQALSCTSSSSSAEGAGEGLVLRHMLVSDFVAQQDFATALGLGLPQQLFPAQQQVPAIRSLRWHLQSGCIAPGIVGKAITAGMLRLLRMQ